MHVLLCIGVLLLCNRVLSLPSLLDISKSNEDTFEKLGILKSNNYFQGAQIFNTYNITVNKPSGNTTCTEQNQTNQVVKIPDLYTLTPGIGAYKLIRSEKTWNMARTHCIAEGAHLAVISSAEEETAINTLLADQMIDEIWIGIHDLFQMGDWVTIFDQPLNSLEYVNWKNGEPNNKQYYALYDTVDGEHCGTYLKDSMSNMRCSKTLAFVCKIIV